MVTNVVTGRRTAGNIRGSKRTMVGVALGAAPQGWAHCSLRMRSPLSGCGRSMEAVKVAESRALEVVAREPDPKLSENALRVPQQRYLKQDHTGHVIQPPKE